MKKIVLFSLLCVMTFVVKAQETEGEEKAEKGFKKENVFAGGSLGLSFGDYTLVNVSPMVGYRFSKLFAAGFGINGQYVGYKSIDGNGDPFKENQGVVGLNIFGRFYPVQQFFLQAQPEANYLFGKRIYYQENPKQEYKLDAVIAPSLLLGGGAVLSPSGKSGVVISILYDVLQHADSPYGNKPVYTVGFNFGL